METPQPWNRNKNSCPLLNSQLGCSLFTRVLSTVTCLLNSESSELLVLYPWSRARLPLVAILMVLCHTVMIILWPRPFFFFFFVTFPLPPPPHPSSTFSQSDAPGIIIRNNWVARWTETPRTLAWEGNSRPVSWALVTLEQDWWESFPTAFFFFPPMQKSSIFCAWNKPTAYLYGTKLIRKKGPVWIGRDVLPQSSTWTPLAQRCDGDATMAGRSWPSSAPREPQLNVRKASSPERFSPAGQSDKSPGPSG